MALIETVAVVGAGPAGCAAGVELARAGKHVVLLEQGSFPRQKVCGEFVSAECLPLLASLLNEAAPYVLAAPRIQIVRLIGKGRPLHLRLPEAAASIPRWDMDEALWRAALRAGCQGRERSGVQSVISTKNGGFELTLTHGEHLEAHAVIDATGRWSRLNRAIAPRTKWIGVKGHFLEAAPAPSCDLYFFRGGYCGVQPIGNGRVNAAAMVRSDAARDLFAVLRLHPALRQRSAEWRLIGEAVATAPLVFRRPQAVRDGVLCAGDAAGFNDPFSGSGISLALHGGSAAGRILASTVSLQQATSEYSAWYEDALSSSFAFTAVMRSVLMNPAARELALRFLPARFLTRQLVKRSRPKAA